MRKRVAIIYHAAGIVAALFGAGASAQTVISPLQVEPDENGVDLLTGRSRLDVPILSVAAAPRLRFDSLQNVMPFLAARISGGQGDYTQSSISVHTEDGISASFRCIYDDQCRDIKVSGASIDGAFQNGSNYVFTQSRSGAIYTFDRLAYDNLRSPRQVNHYASLIEYPDGEKITLSYDTKTVREHIQHRLTKMSSNLGYQIDFSYRSNNESDLSWRQLAQASLSKSDASAVLLARLTYGMDNTITDLAGRVFKCNGCASVIGAPIEVSSGSLTLPGETTPHKSLTDAMLIANDYIAPRVITSVGKDGSVWSYSYGNFRRAPNPNPASFYTYDNVTVSGPDNYRRVYNIVLKGYDDVRYHQVSSVVDSLGRSTSYTYANFLPIKLGCVDKG